MERDQRNIEKGERKQLASTISKAFQRGRSITEIGDSLGMTEKEVRNFCKKNEISLENE